MASDVTINVTVTNGGTIDADLANATSINTTVEVGGQIAAEVTGGGTGPQGEQGEQGIQGETGATGATGPGVPDGGSVGEVLIKLSGADQDTDWHTLVKGDIGLGNVDNTSDANKPVSTDQAAAIAVVQSDINTHEANTSNPHSVTKSQVGLGSVDNVQQQPLDSDLTAIAALTPTDGDMIQRVSGSWLNRTMAQIKTALGLVKGDVGLGNVDNTSDANKPISTATQAALDLKEDIADLGDLAYEDVVTETEISLADNTTNNFSTTKHGFVPKGTNTGKFLKDDGNWDSIPGGGDMLASTYDPQAIGADAFDVDNHTDGTTNKVFTAVEESKLAGIEANADVTDAANVDAAGATMNSDTTLAGNGYFLDEDNMASDSATKVPSQQSVKAYADLKLAKASNLSDVANAATAFGNIKQGATTSATGVVELATDAETLAGTDTGRGVVPSSLYALLSGGWLPFTEALTYASGAGTNVGTFTASGDLTSKYYAGMKGKFVQTTTKYFIITKVAHAAGTTTFTIYMGTDYTIANAAISDAYFSPVRVPAGFPMSPAKWTVTATSTSDRSTTSNGTWATLTDTITIPIGIWYVSLSLSRQHINSSSATRISYVTLSTDASTETNPALTSHNRDNSASSNLVYDSYKTDIIDAAASTTGTLMGKVNGTNCTASVLGSTLGATRIRATCAYL